jgi:hypothetical protein
MVWSTDLFERNSFFVGDLRHWLPSFYDFHGYLTSPQNLAWAIAVALLGLAGVIAGLRDGRGAPVGRDRHGSVWTWTALAGLGAGMIVLLPALSAGVTSIDLIRHFEDAERRPANAGTETLHIVDLTVEGQVRKAIFSRPPTRLIWHLRVPDHAALNGAIAIGRERNDVKGEGVAFRVGVSADGKYDQVFVERVPAGSHTESDGWLPIAVDLSKYRRRRISLILNTESVRETTNEEAALVGYWADLVVSRDAAPLLPQRHHGSTAAARRAGTSAATTPESISTAIAAAKTIGSCGTTWKRNDSTNVERYHAPATPNARPSPRCAMAPPMTRPMTPVRWAPSAIRTPISRVRRATAYAMTP